MREIEILREPLDGSFERRYDAVTNSPGDCIIIHGFKDPGYDTTETLAEAVRMAMGDIENMR